MDMELQRQCQGCQRLLPEGAAAHRKYCSDGCRHRVKMRRRRTGTRTESEVSQLRRHLSQAYERIRVLEVRLGQRAGQRAAMKAKRHAERQRARKIQRDTDRARETVGAELVQVRQALADRERETAEESGAVDPVEVFRLRRENDELRQDVAQAQQVAHQLRSEAEASRQLSSDLTDEVEQYQAIARRMRIKSEAMFTVFGHWDALAGWLDETRDGVGGSEPEQAVLDFWRWMHQQQRHLFRQGYIQTSFEDELGEVEASV